MGKHWGFTCKKRVKHNNNSGNIIANTWQSAREGDSRRKIRGISVVALIFYPLVIQHSYGSRGPFCSMIYCFEKWWFSHSELLNHQSLCEFGAWSFSWLGNCDKWSRTSHGWGSAAVRWTAWKNCTGTLCVRGCAPCRGPRGCYTFSRFNYATHPGNCQGLEVAKK